ncbi:MAG: hypothetical protein IKS31_02965 [Clostridia bacterium]|nr:hypothetical protein [Clostridia bacterium]MBR4457900.1 hypothetical protein [Clostridia bacterium]
MALKGRDGAIYVRAQQGHSIVIWLILSCFVIGIPFVIYYTLSKNHYWHL